MSDEIIKKLEARIEELERKLNPPAPAPVVPSKPYQQPDYTAAMTPGVKLTGREQYRTDQTIEQANMEFRKACNPVGTLMPLAEFLSGKPAEEAPPAEAVTVPIGPPPGTKYVDAIAKGFADRERAEELVKLVDVAAKLRSR